MIKGVPCINRVQYGEEQRQKEEAFAEKEGRKALLAVQHLLGTTTARNNIGILPRVPASIPLVQTLRATDGETQLVDGK